MRRIFVLSVLAVIVIGVVGPATAAAPETGKTYSSQMQVAFSDGPQQVSFSVGESDDQMGHYFYINVYICDYEAPGGPVCWDDTNQNVVVHSFDVTKKGGFLDADVEMRSVFNPLEPNRVVRVTAEFDATEPQVVRTTDVRHDSEYGFYKVTSVRYSDQSPDVSLVFSEWLIDMPLPPLNYAEFSLSNSRYVSKN